MSAPADIKPLPVTETPAAPAVDSTPAVTDTPAVDAPKVDETPAVASTEPTTEAPVEAAATEESKPVEPKESGHVLYHAPGNFLK
jgi:hypothetical protein